FDSVTPRNKKRSRISIKHPNGYTFYIVVETWGKEEFDLARRSAVIPAESEDEQATIANFRGTVDADGRILGALPRKVEIFSGIMLKGGWKFDGQPFAIFNDKGQETNGAHRSNAGSDACIEDPDFEIEVLVVRGIKDEDSTSVDVGITAKAFVTFLAKKGEKNTALLASAVKNFSCYVDAGHRNPAKACTAAMGRSWEDSYALLKRNLGLRDAVETLTGISFPKGRGYKGPYAFFLHCWTVAGVRSQAEQYLRLLSGTRDARINATNKNCKFVDSVIEAMRDVIPYDKYVVVISGFHQFLEGRASYRKVAEVVDILPGVTKN
ncbi:MAG: hypothetical protein ACRDLL_16690, partial [Solirubrobacterales bacterium]